MSNLNVIPLEDGFETSLSQAWDGATGTVYVASTPNFTFPSGVTTYIVVNPGKSNMQIAEINAYNGTAKTLTVNNITLAKGASVNSTAQSHSVGSTVIISDNYQFWADIQTAINSKLDNDSEWSWSAATDYAGIKAKSLTEVERDAITSPVNGMIILNTTSGVLNQYIGGAWATFASGVTPNATNAIAGKVELATPTESKTGTDTGGTGALNFVSPSDIAKNDQSNTFKYAVDAEASDTYVISLTPVLTAYTTGQEITFRPNTANTGACTINIDALGAKSIKLIDGTDPLDGDFATGVDYTLRYDGTNFVLQQVPKRATDAEVDTGTNELNYITPKQFKDNNGFVLHTLAFNGDHGDIVVLTGKTPKMVEMITYAVNSSYNAVSPVASHGFYDGTSYSTLVTNKSVSGNTPQSGVTTTSTSAILSDVRTRTDSGSGDVSTVGVVTNFNSTNVTINISESQEIIQGYLGVIKIYY